LLAQVFFRDDISQPSPSGKENQKENTGKSQEWCGAFNDVFLEMRWLNESFHPNISLGARVLACVTGGLIFYRGIRLYKRTAPDTCLPVNWMVAIPEVAVLVAIATFATACAYRPSGALYWFLVWFFFAYILTMSLPPFQFSCTDLAEHCGKSKDPYIENAVRHADCTLEGYTAQQTLMTWILLLPWIVPRLKLFILVWVWLVSVYFSWALFYRYFMIVARETFTWNEIILHIVLLMLTLCVSMFEKSNLEGAQRNMYIAQLNLKNASHKMFQILQHMVPNHVIAPMIQNPGGVIAEPVNCVSILFVMIAEFEKFASRMSPTELLKFLNDNFTKFDDICAAHRVTKIETVGEEYVCCVGVMPDDIAEGANGHGHILDRLFRAADEILRVQTEEVRFKMGVHTGPVVAGVIGNKLPRYRLFGDTINTSARMMQKGVVGQLQFGDETHKHVPQQIQFQLRGEIEMKGKGLIKAYTHVVEEGAETPAPSIGTLRPKRNSICGDLLKATTDGQEDQNVYVYTPQQEVATEKANVNSDAIHSDGAEGYMGEIPEDPEFEKVLGQMPKRSAEVFSPEMELEWFQWHHTNKVCEGFARSVDIQITVTVFLTVAEVIYMVYTGEDKLDNMNIPGKIRFWLIIVCRAIAVVTMAIWRWASVGLQFFVEQPDFILIARLGSWAFIVGCVFMSYLLLTRDEVAVVITGKGRVEKAPFCQNLSLVFVLAYIVVTRQHGMLFRCSLAFNCVALAVMGFLIYEHLENLVFSIPSKVLFLFNALLSTGIAFMDEKTSRSQFSARRAVEDTQDRIENILKTLMPPLVVKELRALPPGAEQPTHEYDLATICQSDLCGFTRLSASRTPREVVGFMSELFGMFDNLTDQFGVYKVETVGDAYIAGTAEEPLTAKRSPTNVVLFGLAMVSAVQVWAERLGEKVNCRVGVHHGKCIGGIVGSGMQRYHLFGNLLSGMEILESTAPEGRVQVSPACKSAVDEEVALKKPLDKEAKEGDAPPESLGFDLREDDELRTSKGEVHEYSEVGGRTFIVRVAPK